MSITPINKQNILWFVPVIILWTIIILPSSFDAVWSSLDDGVIIEASKAGFWNSFGIVAGRFNPAYWLHHYLLYHISGLNPKIWYFVQSIEFLLSAIFIYISLFWLTEKPWAGFLGSALVLTSSPIGENVYTVSKAEPRILLFFSLTLFFLAACLIKVNKIDINTLRWFQQLYFGLSFLVTSLLVIFTKETGIAIVMVGFSGIIIIYLLRKRLELNYLTDVLKTFTAIFSLVIVVWFVIRIWILYTPIDYNYIKFTPTFKTITDNLKYYAIWHPDIIAIGTMGIIAGIVMLYNGFRQPYIFQISRIVELNIIGWGFYISGMTYFGILILWRWPMGYYMLPVSFFFIISFILLISALFRICGKDRILHKRVMVFSLIMLIIGIGTRVYSLPYVYYIGHAQRSFDKIETSVQIESMRILNQGGRIIDLNRPWFVEQPQQRNLLFRILGRPDLRWIGAGELFIPISEDLRKLFNNTTPPILKEEPLKKGDIILDHDVKYPFPIRLRGIGPDKFSLGKRIVNAEMVTGWKFKEIKKWEESSIVFNPWTFQQDDLVFRSVLYQVTEPLPNRISWEGRYTDDWIGEKARLTVHTAKGYPPGNLYINMPNIPRVLPIEIKIEGEKTMIFSLDDRNLQRSIALSEVLPNGNGDVNIYVYPTWRPSDIMKDNPDNRHLGVQVRYEGQSYRN